MCGGLFNPLSPNSVQDQFSPYKLRRACSQAISPAPALPVSLLLFSLVYPAGTSAEEGAAPVPPPPLTAGGIESVYQKAFLTTDRNFSGVLPR